MSNKMNRSVLGDYHNTSFRRFSPRGMCVNTSSSCNDNGNSPSQWIGSLNCSGVGGGGVRHNSRILPEGLEVLVGLADLACPYRCLGDRDRLLVLVDLVVLADRGRPWRLGDN